MDLGENLYNLRKRKNLSQEEVADKLNVTRQTVSKWETGESKPDFDKIIPICNLFEITSEELLNGELPNKQDFNHHNQEVPKNDFSEIRKKRALFLSIGIFLYFVSVVFIICSEEIGLNSIIGVGGFLTICGIATSLIVYQAIIYSKKEIEPVEEKPENKKLKLFLELVSIIFVIIYLLISFATNAWHITWIIWLIYAAIENIIKIVYEYRGEKNGE